ncbi:pheromone-regulated protein prm10 [Tilletia horrida]|uniref:Pheromone-regulated protein prm10 n=1 Tax=Tilletia horrida TaxID=155126 RepID=A0AAN6GS79_9BASI|nr:pheromone-regulated protein prm10 [Tilletia horrida]KAK0551119.1 pheromone-regulated protein prm10 [Tilletia horrida]KAK0568924.1 pheromone-regulated protein prm10 [Tilletia horrida]
MSRPRSNTAGSTGRGVRFSHDDTAEQNGLDVNLMQAVFNDQAALQSQAKQRAYHAQLAKMTAQAQAGQGVGGNAAGVGSHSVTSPTGDAAKKAKHARISDDPESPSSAPNFSGYRMPQQPEPAAQGHYSRSSLNPYQPPHAPMFGRNSAPNLPPEPQSHSSPRSPPTRDLNAQFSAWHFDGQHTSSSTPTLQHYEPPPSPSTVVPPSPKVPFSPKVTASGSIKSPALKPALTRRDRSAENFRMDQGDPERGAVRRGEAEDVHKTYGSGPNVMKTLVGLYGASSAPGNGVPGLGMSGLGLHRHDSSDSASETTLRDNSSHMHADKGKDFDQESVSTPAQHPGLQRSANSRRQSLSWTLGADDEPMEEDDPRLTGMIRKSMQIKREREFTHRRASWSSEMGDPNVPFKKPALKRRFSLASMTGGDKEKDDGDDYYTRRPSRQFDRRKSATTITCHVSHVAERQKFILKLAKALMLFGAPSHRIESQLNATANVLEVDAQFIHFPGIVIASFGDIDKRTSETHFVKSSSALVLGQLHNVHIIYRQVVHDEISVADGAAQLMALLKEKPCYSVWQRVCIAGLLCWIISPLSFGGSFIDAFISSAYGIGLTFLQLHVARKNAMYSNIFEISVAIIISFISRGLSTTGLFCYQSIASSGVILVLPGYIILCGSLELASKNMIAGSVRMVYAIIYSLFLGFGIAIGSDMYFLLDPAARQSMWVPLNNNVEVQGTFTLTNSTGPNMLTNSTMMNATAPMPMWDGTFTFTNGTTNALNTGSIICERRPEWPWYRRNISPWFNFLFVPVFSCLLCMANGQPLKSRELPVMIIIACTGYVANMTANHFIFQRSDIVSLAGSFVIGILGNAYSRIFRGTAFTAMAVAVLFLVPSGMAMAGGLAMTYRGSDGDLYSNGLSIGFRMVSVAIGITVGLFGSGLVIYSFGRRKGSALFGKYLPLSS